MFKLVLIFKKIRFNITTLYYFLLFKKPISNDFLIFFNRVGALHVVILNPPQKFCKVLEGYQLYVVVCLILYLVYIKNLVKEM
jgi:hypothetical protein